MEESKSEGFFATNIFQVILDHIEIVLRHRKVLVITFLVINVPVFFNLLFSDPYYTAKATILPPEKSSSGFIPGLQGATSRLLGISVPAQNDVTLLYNDILRSRRISSKILQSKFEVKGYDKPVKLIDYLKIEADSESERVQRANKLYNGMIGVSIDNNSKKATIMATTPEPQLSADIANMLVEELDKFNTELATGKASESREFIEGRLSATKMLLQAAEDALKVFRENNKRIENSPELQLHQGRLIREVRIQEEVFITLKKEFETVKIEEVKNLPSVRILDTALAPYEKSGPLRRRAMMVAVVLSLGLGIALAYLWEYGERVSRNSVLTSRLVNIPRTIIGDVAAGWAFFKTKILRLKPKEISMESDEEEDDQIAEED